VRIFELHRLVAIGRQRGPAARACQ
jgi:hypothetical protein